MTRRGACSRPIRDASKCLTIAPISLAEMATSQEAINLDSADDHAAIESANQLVDDYDVEVWHQDRLVAKLQSQTE